MYSTACRLDEWVPLGEAETSEIVPRKLRGALAGATENAKRKMLRKVWARADADNSGSVEFDEFLIWCNHAGDTGRCVYSFSLHALLLASDSYLALWWLKALLFEVM